MGKLHEGCNPLRGVKMADTRKAVHGWWKSDVHTISAPRQRDLAFALIRQRHAEDKLAGVLFLHEILLPRGVLSWRRDLPVIAKLFDQGHIADWNTCDWFCVKVLNSMFANYGERCARAIGGWYNAKNLWRQRASAVAFVNTAEHGDANFPGYTAMVIRSCRALIRRKERFAQTGAAWTLRELSLSDRALVLRLVEEHIDTCSHEAIRSVTEKMPVSFRRRLLQLHRDASRQERGH